MTITPVNHPKYHFQTDDAYLFENMDDAQDWETRRDAFRAVVAALKSIDQPDRAMYEQLCAQWNAPCHTDHAIRGMTYAIRYGEFWPEPVTRWNGTESRGYPVEKYIEMRLAGARLAGIEAEASASTPKPQPRQPDYPNGRTLDCGCTVYNRHEVMSASMGTSCSDCYDRMSD